MNNSDQVKQLEDAVSLALELARNSVMGLKSLLINQRVLVLVPAMVKLKMLNLTVMVR